MTSTLEGEGGWGGSAKKWRVMTWWQQGGKVTAPYRAFNVHDSTRLQQCFFLGDIFLIFLLASSSPPETKKFLYLFFFRFPLLRKRNIFLLPFTVFLSSADQWNLSSNIFLLFLLRTSSFPQTKWFNSPNIFLPFLLHSSSPLPTKYFLLQIYSSFSFSFFSRLETKIW